MSAVELMLELTLCEIIKKDRILLKRASRGVSKGKWNGLGGRLEKGETPEEGILREVFEESGLRATSPEKVGILNFYVSDRAHPYGRCHLFMIRSFEGTPTSGDEGELKWFQMDKIPYEKMWDDDRYWLRHALDGKKFDAEFVFDGQRMERIKEFSVVNLHYSTT